MQLKTLFTVLAVAALAEGQNVLPSSVETQCFTRYSTVKPPRVSTTNWETTTTVTARQTVTVTPIKTLTPLPITSTVTTTPVVRQTITAPTSTNTYTTSTTITTTTTSTTVESYTHTVTTSTTVIVQSTQTVPAPTGFVGLAAMSGFAAKRDLEARAAATGKPGYVPIIAPKAPAAKLMAVAALRVGEANAAQYPVALICTRRTSYFTTSTIKATAATTTVRAPTQTSFTTVTVPTTTTITVTPAAVTKIITVSSDTVIIHQTSTTSTTTTNTATVTVEKASATFLAQCAKSNQVASAVGQKIGTISFNPAFVLQSLYVTDTTGYGCCAICAANPRCAGYAQGPKGGACYYITTDGRCDVSQSWGDRFHYYNTNGDGYTVGNGQCGFLGPSAGPPPV